MAKKSAIDKNKKRIQMVEQQKDKRAALKKVIKDISQIMLKTKKSPKWSKINLKLKNIIVFFPFPMKKNIQQHLLLFNHNETR